MSRSICCAFWLTLIVATAPIEAAGPVTIGEKTVLVYRNEVQKERHQFVLRIARFRPDIFLEWESRDHQGTVHIYRKAVAEAKMFTLSSLFEIGVDTEGKKVTTKWLSRKLFRRLLNDGEVELKLNRIEASLRVVGERALTVRLNRKPAELPGIEVEDSRNGRWLFLNDPENPLVMEYSTTHYREVLEAVSTDPKNKLRWIRKLPPVK